MLVSEPAVTVQSSCLGQKSLAHSLLHELNMDIAQGEGAEPRVKSQFHHMPIWLNPLSS